MRDEFRRRVVTATTLAVVTLLAGCSVGRPKPHSSVSPAPPQTVVLIGIDALRWDFRSHARMPALEALRDNGVAARRLIPPFPTKTFPSFYTLATGLYPAHHGVVGNNIRDPELGDDFSLYNRESVKDGRWYEGEPIWVTAERQGVRSATYFWPGSEAEIGGLRPSYWLPYDGKVPNLERVRQVLEWLELPPELRPRLILLYFSVVDEVAHAHPPVSAEVSAALQEVDRALAALVEGLERLEAEETVNLVLTSDHGMAPTSADRVIFIDDLIDPTDAEVLDENPLLWVFPAEGRRAALLDSLRHAHPHLRAFDRDTIPARFHYAGHRRISPIVVLADEGWSFAARAEYEADPARFDGGSHGYDNRLLSMGATLIASGPAFRRGSVTAPVESIHVYPLICRVLGLEPAPVDGTLEELVDWLAP